MCIQAHIRQRPQPKTWLVPRDILACCSGKTVHLDMLLTNSHCTEASRVVNVMAGRVACDLSRSFSLLRLGPEASVYIGSITSTRDAVVRWNTHGMVRACPRQSFFGGIVKSSGRILPLEDFTALWDRPDSSGGARARTLMYTMDSWKRSPRRSCVGQWRKTLVRRPV